MSTALVKRSRYKRAALDQTLYFTERDFSILHTLYKYHLATTHQLVAAHPGNDHKTRKRLRKLYDAGYVERFHTKTDMTIPGSEPIVYALTDQGADWLSHHRQDVERQRARYNERNARRTLATIPHTLMVADFMLNLELKTYYQSNLATLIPQHELLMRVPAVVRERRSPTQWNMDIFVKGTKHRIGNNPDQMFGVVDHARDEGHGNLYFFLEADRGTETVRPVTRRLEKATIYKKLLGYYHTHVEHTHRAIFGEWFRNFRVLWVIDSNGRARDGRTRLQNFLDTTTAVTDGKLADLFLFATYSDLIAHGDVLTYTWVNAKGEPRQILTNPNA